MTRALLSLIACAGLATASAAAAQELNSAASAPAEAPAASPEPSAAPAPDAAVEAPAPERPVLPTTGDGAAVLSAIEKVCIPQVRGQDLAKVAAAEGYKRNRREETYSKPIGTKPYEIIVQSPGSNAQVCSLSVRYAIGQEKPIIEALTYWAFLHDPELKLQRNDFAVGPDGVKRITLAWEHYTSRESTGLVLVQLKRPDGAPLNEKYDEATVLYSERTF